MQAGAPGSPNYKVMGSRPANPLSLGFQEHGRQSILIEILPYFQPALEVMPLPLASLPAFRNPYSLSRAMHNSCPWSLV